MAINDFNQNYYKTLCCCFVCSSHGRWEKSTGRVWYWLMLYFFPVDLTFCKIYVVTIYVLLMSLWWWFHRPLFAIVWISIGVRFDWRARYVFLLAHNFPGVVLEWGVSWILVFGSTDNLSGTVSQLGQLRVKALFVFTFSHSSRLSFSCELSTEQTCGLVPFYRPVSS